MRLGGWLFAMLAACIALMLVRCGGSSDCASNADCSSGQACVFAATGGCSAKGTCANPTDDCDSTFTNVACGCHDDTVKEAKCLDVGGYLGRVSPSQHCFDPDAGTLFPPDGSDDVAIIRFDASPRDASTLDTSVAD